MRESIRSVEVIALKPDKETKGDQNMDINRDKLRVFEVVGEEKEKNQSKIFEQAESWGITLPETPSFMLHFCLDDFFVTGETEFWIANEVNAGYCAKSSSFSKVRPAPTITIR